MAITMSAVPAVPQQLVIKRPDDWHLHLRDGSGLQSVVPHSAHHFARAVIMPNLQPPVTTAQQVQPARSDALGRGTVYACRNYLESGYKTTVKNSPRTVENIAGLSDSTACDRVNKAVSRGGAMS